MSTQSIAVSQFQNQDQDSVFEVVRLVDTELHDLLARREEVNSRIQNLHQVMHGLREVVRRPGSGNLKLESIESPEQIVKVVQTTGDAGSRLIRACRIALIESASTASIDEIYSRIVRRGSFLFLSPEFAAPAILRALRAMAAEGEIRCVKDGIHPRWERLAKTVIDSEGS